MAEQSKINDPRAEYPHGDHPRWEGAEDLENRRARAFDPMWAFAHLIHEVPGNIVAGEAVTSVAMVLEALLERAEIMLAPLARESKD